jgi:hypothetical protein
MSSGGAWGVALPSTARTCARRSIGSEVTARQRAGEGSGWRRRPGGEQARAAAGGDGPAAVAVGDSGVRRWR